MRLDSSLHEIKGVGPALEGLFKRLKVYKVADLIEHYPRRYDDYSVVQNIADLQPGPISIKARITQVSGRYGRRRGMHVTEALAHDKTGSIKLTWFNQPYRAASLKNNQDYYLSGTYDFSGKHLSLINPSIELATDKNINTARILPVYKETKGLTSARIRQVLMKIRPAFERIEDPLSAVLQEKAGLLPLNQALVKLHFPDSSADYAQARFELGVRELFELSLASLLLKQEIHKLRAEPIPVDEQTLKQVAGNFGFTLTDEQRRVAWTTIQSMAQAEFPENRLIEGDVGSGKTAIAAMVMACALQAGHQVALMAPTELLANQHYKEMKKMLSGVLPAKRIGFVSGSLPLAAKSDIYRQIETQKIDLVIGTHAVFQDRVTYADLQLIIIDEQHRFGVEQRKQLLSKSRHMPHVITLTATPIPRSLGLVLYGELDISVLSGKPPGRKPIDTKLISLADRYKQLKNIIDSVGPRNQLYIVCPSIESTDNRDSIEEIAVELNKRFKDVRFAIMHGKMKQAEKDQIMADFVAGKIHILLATTVIEVGVNVVNAHTMAIVAPERFGLAQLHQLRGRVGRGDQPGTCLLLLSSNQSPPKRLKYIEQIQDGFRLSEIDLELRGPGAIYGTRQSGSLDLRLANIADHKQVAKARSLAEFFVSNDLKLVKYKQLQTRIKNIQKVTNLN